MDGADAEGAPGAGRIVLAATPLGNPGDASPRLRAALQTADVIAAEDTRRLRRLLSDLDVTVSGRIRSFHDANERDRSEELAELALDGATILVVSDAGMPTVSDPGFRLVSLAAARGIAVTVLPGPSAVLAALAVSGLPVDRFCFEGFLPRKAGERAGRIADLAAETRTMVIFEAPHRLPALLAALVDGLGGERRAVVCRELTKTYEEVRRGTLGQLADWAREGVRGEITLVVAGADLRRPAPGMDDRQQWIDAVAGAEQDGLSRRDAIAAVAVRLGVPRREVYDAVVKWADRRP